MTRPRAAEKPRPLPKAVSLEEVANGTVRLEEVLAAINDFSQEGFPYRDAARAKVELQLRECVKQIFGERSQEFHTYRNFILRTSNKEETARSIAAVKDLIKTLDDKKLELQSLKPARDTVRMRLVTPTPQATLAQPSLPTPEQLLQPESKPPMHQTSADTIEAIPPASALVNTSSPPPRTPAAPAPTSTSTMPSAPTLPLPTKTTTAPEQPPSSNTPPLPSGPMQPSVAQTASDAPPFQPVSERETLQLIRKVCLRLHAVARQLRLRKDSRPTLNIEDDYDLQDLLRALLKVEFDEVEADEWTPPYAENGPRTTLLLEREQIAVVAKKTRSGLTVRAIAEQVAADSAFYSARNNCTTLFCFIYDPEGRIGSPRRLETDLTSVSDRYCIEVLVAPK